MLRPTHVHMQHVHPTVQVPGIQIHRLLLLNTASCAFHSTVRSTIGYVEAIEARLHRMEGFLDGLIKDKDPLAEIVRAELDAMSREAEATGLTSRQSKLYEATNHVRLASQKVTGARRLVSSYPSPLIHLS